MTRQEITIAGAASIFAMTTTGATKSASRESRVEQKNS